MLLPRKHRQVGLLTLIPFLPRHRPRLLTRSLGYPYRTSLRTQQHRTPAFHRNRVHLKGMAIVLSLSFFLSINIVVQSECGLVDVRVVLLDD
jgi:hypothetical protein